MTKDVYYSPFVHLALTVGANYFHVLEMVYCLVFSPSPSGWCEGVSMASSDASDNNFVFKFIDAMRDQYGSVSGGGHRRRQVSHQKKAKRRDIALSLWNLLSLINIANISDDTSSLVHAFTKSAAEGGLFLVGPLIAQEIINILTKIGIITNDCPCISINHMTSSKMHYARRCV